ncbi:hypothetical protein ACFLR1_02965 [Bacteroidota bacterium]
MNSRWNNFSLLAIMMVMTIVTSNLNWGGNYWQSIIEADGKGYYAYLPASFIYHDLNFGFFEEIEEEKYYHQNLFYDYRATSNNQKINKYYCGTALAELPFFLIAHSYCLLSNEFPADGYAKPYPIMITVAALFWLFIGLLFAGKLMETYGVKPPWISVSLAAMVFGTNLFYYTVGEPSMSHVYSSALIACFVFVGRKFFQKQNKMLLPAMALLLGVIVLIRPTNAVILGSLPFIAGNWRRFMDGIQALKTYLPVVLLSFVLLLLAVSIQPIIYKLSCGQFFVYSYTGEGFNFLSPHLLDILFSYKKGLFLYTPIYLLGIALAFWVWKKNRYQLVSFVLFFAVLTYLLSSWWNWWYGGSFSSRVYVDFLSILMLPIPLFLSQTKLKWVKTWFTLLIFALVALCQIQTYQYRYYDIHWEEMTKEKYWNNF